ncbi:MAG: 4Fe-4S binding protein [Bacteroidales bacterium]|nr:4Fe-4S binding protein [Bacteroidales bacterium]
MMIINKLRRRASTGYIALDSRNCKACWECVDACPQKVIGKVKVFSHRHARIVDAESCIGCRKCVKACRYGAILSIVEQ